MKQNVNNTNKFNYDSEMRNSLNCMTNKNFDGGIRFDFSTPGSTITSLTYTSSYSIFLYSPSLIFPYSKSTSSFILTSPISFLFRFSSLTSLSILSLPLLILSHLPTLFITSSLLPLSSLLASLLLLFILTSFPFSTSLLLSPQLRRGYSI